MSIFASATKRLTLTYLAVIMIISIGFSFALYVVSVREVERSLSRPNRPINMLIQGLQERPLRYQEAVDLERKEILDDVKAQLVKRLLIVNAVVLFGGWVLSSYLAKNTVRPIEEAHRSLERFTADASHELKTPITAVKTENEVALSDDSLTIADAKKVMVSTIEELDKMTLLTNNLLQLSRFNTLTLNRKSTDIKLLVEHAITKLQSSISDKKMTVNVEFPKETMVTVDAELIEQVIVILLDNAIKYSGRGTEIKINLNRNDDKVSLHIIDQGIGIPTEHVKHIFDRFYRIDESRAKTSGIGSYGLGLSIANEIVKSHNGTIEVKSKPKKGSTFTINL